jgi:hypothetical protein
MLEDKALADAEWSHVLLAVRDSGPGLDPKGLDRLFDAFYTTMPQGLGMGLAISRSIIEAHDRTEGAWCRRLCQLDFRQSALALPTSRDSAFAGCAEKRSSRLDVPLWQHQFQIPAHRSDPTAPDNQSISDRPIRAAWLISPRKTTRRMELPLHSQYE